MDQPRIMKDIHKILVICTGNSCRSIMAEAYMRHRFGEEKMDIHVRSAGTLGVEGMPPSPEALKILAIADVDTDDLMSKALKEEDVKWADLVLVMEPIHKNAVLEMVPGMENKVAYLGQFNPEGGDIVIPDPIGRPLAFYRASFRIIKHSVEGLIEWLKR